MDDRTDEEILAHREAEKSGTLPVGEEILVPGPSVKEPVKEDQPQ